MSELTKRVLFALIAAPAFMGITWMGGTLFAVLMMIIAIAAQVEMIGMIRAAKVPVHTFISISLGMTIFSFFSGNTMVLQVLVFWFLVLVVATTLMPGHDRILYITTTLYVGFYAPIGMAALAWIRSYSGNQESDLFLAALVILMIWANDTFAYMFGRTFGKHLFAPQISPKKTWEGFAGGFVGAGLVLAVMVYFFGAYAPFPLAQLWPLALIVSVLGPIGDLAASKLKRWSGKKDSSNILPGHGGVFDRFDAFLLVCPALFLYLDVLKS